MKSSLPSMEVWEAIKFLEKKGYVCLLREDFEALLDAIFMSSEKEGEEKK